MKREKGFLVLVRSGFEPGRGEEISDGENEETTK